jgi:hypothetical protein
VIANVQVGDNERIARQRHWAQQGHKYLVAEVQSESMRLADISSLMLAEPRAAP